MKLSFLRHKSPFFPLTQQAHIKLHTNQVTQDIADTDLTQVSTSSIILMYKSSNH